MQTETGFLIRAERPGDEPGTHAVHAAAFPTPAEALVVDLLRARGKALVSLVAELETAIVGHVLFTPVELRSSGAGVGAGAGIGVGLAPVAVLPNFHGRGIGSALVRAGIGVCRERGYGYAVVLGSPPYYGRFGFVAAEPFKLINEYGAGAAFQVIELRDGGVPATGGLVRYAAEFAELGV